MRNCIVFPRPFAAIPEMGVVITDAESATLLPRSGVGAARGRGTGCRATRPTPALSVTSVSRVLAGAFCGKDIIPADFADQAMIAIRTELFEEVQARTRDLAESLRQRRYR
jgi:hypothetical protein